jgi:uncharacterized FAD-dependent dehydrogenase
MIRISEIKLPLDHADEALRAAVVKRLRITDGELAGFTVFKRSFDARKKKNILLVYIVDATVSGDEEAVLQRLSKDRNIRPAPDTEYRLKFQAPEGLSERPVVIGTGPCGYFAGLLLAQMGFRPIILERGENVRKRTKDTFGFWRKRQFNPQSNVQFGEGGAGTFSDGKLYSQIKDKGNYGRKVLTEMVENGAREEILYKHRPHIGTFRLVKIVEGMRATIEELGGEVRFRSHVTDVIIKEGQVEGVQLADGSVIDTRHVVMAVGHSARDTFEMLLERGVHIEPKPFSIGVRIEHPQGMIDRCRFGDFAGNKTLGSADYRLVHPQCQRRHGRGHHVRRLP